MNSIKVLQKYFNIVVGREEIVLTAKAEPPPGDVTKVLAALQEIKRHKINTLNSLRSPPKQYKKALAVDIETTHLDPLKGEIILISVYGKGVEIVTSDINEVSQLLRDDSILKVFHNASFDITWLRTKGFEVKSYADTLIMSQIYNNQVKNSDNSLKGMVSKHLNIELDKTLQPAENWQGEITQAHKEYCLADSKATLALYYFLSEQLTSLHLYCVLRREMAAMDAVIELNINGIRFDYDEWELELQKMSEESEQIRTQVREFLKVPDLNLQSPSQLIKALKNKGIEIEGTSDEILAKYEDRFEIIKLIRCFKKLRKQANSYGEKLREKISDDGRLRGSWKLIGTDTSRMTCKEPNLQGMPGRSKPYFRPAEGHSLIVADYSNIELRILAEITKDPELVKAFHNNEDLHEKTAKVVLNKQLGDQITAEERKIGKVVNFGLVYGMTKWGLQKKIQAATGLPISLNEAETFRNRYFDLYKGVLSYQDKMLRSSFIETLGGRYWSDDYTMLPKGAIARFNYPIQATGAEGLKESLALFLEGRKASWRLVAAVHDEIVLEVPDAEVDAASSFLENIMVAGMKTLVQQIPIAVEMKNGQTWCK